MWAVWNFSEILFFGILGAMAYLALATGQADMVKPVVNSRLGGLAFACVSGFSVGVYFLVSVAIYFLLVTLFVKLKLLRSREKLV